MAGTGKTAVAQSFAQILARQKLLGGSFFCFRSVESRSQAHYIIPTIAYQLAQKLKAYRGRLITTLAKERGSSPRAWALQNQFDQLIVEPSAALDTASLPPVVIVDALDECSDPRATRDFLTVILGKIPLNVKFFITSRPERHISRSFSEAKSHSALRLHDIETSLVASDIAKYLTHVLSEFSQSIGASQWPSDKDIAKLVEKAGKLFIFAFTAARYISELQDISLPHAARRLSSLLTSSNSSTETIDTLYTEIFQAAYAKKQQHEIQTMREGLDTVICLREPLSAGAISTLLNPDPKDAVDLLIVLSRFHSVIDMRRIDDAVLIFHSSFPDYMTDPSRSGHYFLDTRRYHATLALKCIQCMNYFLKENPCGITEETQIADITEAVLQEPIPIVLRYACLHWATHLALALPTPSGTVEIIAALREFAHSHILHWLECLSLIRKLDLAVDCLQHAIFIQSVRETQQIWDLLDEARRMVPQIFKFVSQYPLEVYRSALEWLPLLSKIRKIYPLNSIRRVRLGVVEQWGACEQVLGHASSVTTVVFSPDGSRIASSSGDRTVRIWSVATGQQERELVGHTDYVNTVAFSPDGSRIVSGSDDKTVRIWSVATGQQGRELVGHTNYVNTVAFSPDGSRIVSGSRDETVRIWSVATGQQERELVGHTNYVNTVAFSPDGSRIASGSDDKTVRIWSVATGQQERELMGHTNWVGTVAFSPDGSRIASGSGDKTVRIWSVATGQQERVLVGHTDWVRTVAFSPDGSRIASGSNDKTVRIWSIATGQQERVLVGHTNWVRTVAFSPDGSRIVSGSDDKTVRIWSIATGQQERELVGHTNWVRTVAFSPDGSRIASGSDDKTVRIWSIATGQQERELVGHTNYVITVAFSPDGSRIASGSDDKTVRIWSVATGQQERELVGHTDYVNTVAFSPDGSHIASGSDDETVRIWSVATGQQERELVGHTDYVNTVAFSPDGSRIASGSRDKTVRIWSVATGQQERELVGHTNWVRTVAFSPDGSRIASGSDDKTVRIWSVAAGVVENILCDNGDTSA
ncbi:quinon protein alcohol dehydrogenase-like superfamily [Mycena sp. CBHHK59/15]|nr:quinon protein alcohol dehydrogenase-like superfamily [Mycena sp. CBHHK59/15]